MTPVEHLLEDALASARPVTLSLAEVGARGLLEALAARGASFHVDVRSPLARVEVEIGTGLVVGARATRDGTQLEGREAYALLRRIKQGTATVTPKRFLSMANVLEPIGALPDLGRISSAPPPGPHDTVEVALPEARPPVRPPEPLTEEIELPPELRVPELRVTVPPPPRRRRPHPEPARPPRRRRRWVLAAAALVGVSGLATVAVAALGTPAPAADRAPIAIEAPRELARLAPLPEPPPPSEESADEELDRSEASRLAREARLLIRQGRPRVAVARARRAAHLRRGLPYYQLVLGDALAASGREAEARRAWRRALRLRPSYRAAAERLERDRPTS